MPWLIALGVFAAYATISLCRYVRLTPGSWDLGIFTEYVRQLAHLHAPVVNIRGPGFNLLGDHFQPIVGLIAPLFLLVPSAATLLVVQVLLTAASVVPVSRAAASRLGTGAGRMIGAAYGLSWGLQQMIDFDFHEIAFAVPLLACSLSALLRGKVRAAAMWALPLVYVKEDQGFTVAAIGVLIAVMSLTRAGESRPAGRAAFRWGALLTVWGPALARVPAGTTVEATLTMLAPLAARDDTYWIGKAGNPAPRYVVFDELDSGWKPPPGDPLTFVERRHPGATYRQVYESNFVYVFRRVGGPGS